MCFSLELENETGFVKIDMPRHVDIFNISKKLNHINIELDVDSSRPSTVYESDANVFRKSQNIKIKNSGVIAELMTSVINNRYKNYFGSTLVLSEPLQYLAYNGHERGFFKTHSDSAFLKNNKIFVSEPLRHISVILYLSNADEYTGGLLTFDKLLDEQKVPLTCPKFDRGDVVVFSSDYRYQHSVSVVTGGIRQCIVAWFSIE